MPFFLQLLKHSYNVTKRCALFFDHLYPPLIYTIFIKKLYNLDGRLSEEWIKTGKGEMLIIEATHTINGDGNTAIHGNGNQVNSETTRFLALLEKKDEQIDRLLAIIESVTNK